MGCVIADADGKVIGQGRNRRQERPDATAHAEVEAIRQACAALGDWRLNGCTLYVTLEPCPMCAGTAVNARIPRIVFGAYDQKAGAMGSVYTLQEGKLNHTPEVLGGILAQECAELLSGYFKQKRGGK